MSSQICSHIFKQGKSAGTRCDKNVSATDPTGLYCSSHKKRNRSKKQQDETYDEKPVSRKMDNLHLDDVSEGEEEEVEDDEKEYDGGKDEVEEQDGEQDPVESGNEEFDPMDVLEELNALLAQVEKLKDVSKIKAIIRAAREKLGSIL